MALLTAGWGRAVKLGLLGGVVFLLAITPLGPGSGFPFTLIAIVAAWLLLCSPLQPALTQAILLDRRRLRRHSNRLDWGASVE